MSFLPLRQGKFADWWAPTAPLGGFSTSGGRWGVLLGLLGRGYLALLMHFPVREVMIRRSQQEMEKTPNWRLSLVVMGVLLLGGRRYLFRGLMFRAGPREGGWQAVLGAPAFLAVYRAPLSWPPVFLVGLVTRCCLRKAAI